MGVPITRVDLVEQRIDSHEEVCAERYREIDKKIDKLEGRFEDSVYEIKNDIKSLVVKCATAVMGGMFGIIMAILFK